MTVTKDLESKQIRKCIWKGCRTKIELDTSIESRQTLFTVAGWCKVHQLAYSIYLEMEKKYCKDKKLEWPLGSISYQKHENALHQLHDLAEHRAKEKIKYES